MKILREYFNDTLTNKYIENIKTFLKDNNVIESIEGEYILKNQRGPIVEEKLILEFEDFHITPSLVIYAIYKEITEFKTEYGVSDTSENKIKIDVTDIISGKYLKYILNFYNKIIYNKIS